MDPDKTTMERAFELARSGKCSDVYDLVRRLDREGYDGNQIQGPVLRKQLANMIGEAWKSHSGRDERSMHGPQKARSP